MAVFRDIWTPWEAKIQDGTIISVDEVLCELRQIWVEDSEPGIWLKEHRKCFRNTTNEEGFILAEIFRYKKFREGIKETSLRSGTPEADAMLVAKAKATGGIVVTTESSQKPNAEKIPNIAVTLGVPYMGIDQFYQMLRNVHYGHSEMEGVRILHELDL